MHKKGTIITFCVMVIMIGMAATSHAATSWYVSPTGNDTIGNGSSGSPWATLSNACSKVTNAGDTINLAAGNYTDNNPCTLGAGVNIAGAGSGSTYITSSYSGGYYITLVYAPAMSGAGTANGNQTISGFTLDGNNKALLSGIQIIGYNHVTLNDLDFKHINEGAIKLEGLDNWTNILGINGEDYNVPPPYYGQYNTLTNITITGCSAGSTASDPYGAVGTSVWVHSQQYMTWNNVNIDETPSTTTGEGFPVVSVPGWINASTINNCSFRVGNSGWGVTNNGSPSTFQMWNIENGTIISNSNFYEGYISLVAGDMCGGQGNGSSSLITSCSATRALIFHDNNLIDTAYQGGTGHELSLSNAEYYNNYIEMGTAGFWVATHSFNLTGMNNISFHNNIVHNANGNSVIIQTAPANVAISGLSIYNNTFDTAASAWPYSGILVQIANTLTGLAVENNIFMNFPSGYEIYFYTGSTTSPKISYNDYYNTTGIDYIYSGASAPGLTAINNITSNPEIVGTGSKYPYFTGTYYQLQAGSPMKNAGVNVGLSFTGSAPNIGAGNSVTLSAPTSLTVQ
ncbi:MAG: hypothetical protein P4L44_06795 [Oryzomonas sp.]|uniref:hypothetical protein n=1 Tax=Oryzomonas sp. TaxID=2855186 RepID=UPI002847E744|nr:hypothetical protein [Oryzomonas sp.]MDR3579651.1 hypothetical protein [Oryzomonas sp.]